MNSNPEKERNNDNNYKSESGGSSNGKVRRKILMVINPVSGKLRVRSSLYDIVTRLASGGCVPTLRLTEYRTHAAAIAADAGRSGEYDGLLCCGGDGTLNEVIGGIIDSGAGANLPLGYIPAGSTNDFAASMGLPLEPAAAAELFARALCGDADKKGKTDDDADATADSKVSGDAYADTAANSNADSCADADDDGEAEKCTEIPVNVCASSQLLDIGRFGGSRYFTYIASFGAFTASSYSAPQAVKNSIGHLAYVLEGIRDFFRIKPIHASVVTCDGRHYEGDYVFGGVTNSTSVGGIVKLGGELVDMNDGLFEVVLIKHPKNTAEFNRITQAVLSSHLECDMIEFFKTSSITFTMPDGTAWSLDGERAEGGGKILIENLHSAVRLVK